jgi:hypothetical protein
MSFDGTSKSLKIGVNYREVEASAETVSAEKPNHLMSGG